MTNSKPNLEAKLADEILAYLASAEKSGEAGESVSYIHRNLARDGWKGLGVLADFEDLIERLGFRVVDGKNSRGQSRREVRL